jgi:23S rRNA pseudouridine1911/1915/1917 synthase
MSFPILYQDKSCLVIEKPEGVTVNRSHTMKDETVQDWWWRELGFAPQGEAITATIDSTPEEIFESRGGIVHRLDKDTSGALLLAKTPEALVELLRQFREREVEKTYVCLVHGKFEILEDTITLRLARSRKQRTQFTADIDGREAETKYQILKEYSSLSEEWLAGLTERWDGKPPGYWRTQLRNAYQGFSLVECQPKTGRTHQLRVHLKALGHAVVGDAIYLGARRLLLDQLWAKRLGLHARQLVFSSPETGQKVVVESPLPASFTQILQKLTPVSDADGGEQSQV